MEPALPCPVVPRSRSFNSPAGRRSRSAMWMEKLPSWQIWETAESAVARHGRPHSHPTSALPAGQVPQQLTTKMASASFTCWAPKAARKQRGLSGGRPGGVAPKSGAAGGQTLTGGRVERVVDVIGHPGREAPVVGAVLEKAGGGGTWRVDRGWVGNIGVMCEMGEV